MHSYPRHCSTGERPPGSHWKGGWAVLGLWRREKSVTGPRLLTWSPGQQLTHNTERANPALWKKLKDVKCSAIVGYGSG